MIEDSAVDEVLAFTVTDDGVGMGEAGLLRLRNEMRRTGGSECYGIANVDRQLRPFFGDECGLAIESMLDAGTVVTIRIPQLT